MNIYHNSTKPDLITPIESPWFPRGYAMLALSANQPLNPYELLPPIIWKGSLNGLKIEIHFLSEGTSNSTQVDFIEYPSELNLLKPEILRAIDERMAQLD
jgi:hypothetical protein